MSVFFQNMVVVTSHCTTLWSIRCACYTRNMSLTSPNNPTEKTPDKEDSFRWNSHRDLVIDIKTTFQLTTFHVPEVLVLYFDNTFFFCGLVGGFIIYITNSSGPLKIATIRNDQICSKHLPSKIWQEVLYIDDTIAHLLSGQSFEIQLIWWRISWDWPLHVWNELTWHYMSPRYFRDSGSPNFWQAEMSSKTSAQFKSI